MFSDGLLAFMDGLLVFMDGLLVLIDGLLVFIDGLLVFIDGLIVFIDGLLVVWVDGIIVISISSPILIDGLRDDDDDDDDDLRDGCRDDMMIVVSNEGFINVVGVSDDGTVDDSTGMIDDWSSVGSNENGDGAVDGTTVGSFNGDVVETIQANGFNIVGLVVVGLVVVGLVVVGMNNLVGDIVSDFHLLGWGLFDGLSVIAIDGLKGDDDGDFDGAVDNDATIDDGTTDCNCDGI